MKKILIIEDDNAIAEIEKDYLTLSGLDATIITDGEKGLEEAGYDVLRGMSREKCKGHFL